MASNNAKEKSQFTTRNKYEEYFRLFFHQLNAGVWLAEFDEPLPINLSIEVQAEHLLKHAYLSDCNLTFVKMYGYEDPQNLINARFPQLFDNGEASNLENLCVFLRDGYQAQDIGTIEIARNCQKKYFLNDVVGVVEDGHLVRVWGMQKDVTSEKAQKEILKQLTSEQIKVLKSTVEGKTMKEIASEVGVSPKTVESVRSQLKTIFGATTVAQLIGIAIQLGIQALEI